MGWKIFLSFVFILFVMLSFFLYWFISSGTANFKVKENSIVLNASIEKGAQFYANMRYPGSKISYKIDDCPLQKEDDMIRAFDIISKQTNLSFYAVQTDEEISVTCDSKNKFEGGLFIAGEGGPSNITVAGDFNVIFNGKILLIRSSLCSKPNIALHELLHALGFDHSEDKANIMYSISDCDQIIGEEIIDKINELYAVPSYPDLSFQNVSSFMHGTYLDVNMSVRSIGFIDAGEAEIKIYADGKFIEVVELDPLPVGFGRSISLINVWVKKRSVDNLEFVIESSFEELDKENNKVVLEVSES